MMDFDNILDIATQNQGVSGVQVFNHDGFSRAGLHDKSTNSQQIGLSKRYSLQAGPPKKDPRSKGVNPAAVQALLKKQQVDNKKKEIQMKKQKEELLAKRVELKSDRKARAMASRTKDNFRGYNGIPVVETPKKRRTKQEMEAERAMNHSKFGNYSVDPEDDEDNYEYEQTDSEPELEAEPLRPGKTSHGSGSSSGGIKPSSKKTSGPPKGAPNSMNFAELLKLAEKKQHEPVELKPKIVKKEERLRTADEIRELEMERKAKRPYKDKERNPRAEREKERKPQSSSSSVKHCTLEKEQKNGKPSKNSLEKSYQPSGSMKKSHQFPNSNKGHSSSKPTVSDRERERPKMLHSDKDRSRMSMSTSSGAPSSKVPPKATSSQVSAKQGGLKPSSSHKSSTSSDLINKKESSSSLYGRSSGVPGSRPSGPGQKSQNGNSQQVRPSQSSFNQGGVHKFQGKGEPARPGINSAVKSSNSGMRPSLNGPPKTGGQPQSRPGGVPQARPAGRGLQGHPGGSGFRPAGMGPGRPGSGAPARPSGTMGSGPGRPKCTVVSETISSKNVGGSRPGGPPRPGMQQRPGMAPRPGMAQRPGMPPRPMMNRPPGPMLPPITSAYKRRYEEDEDEYDSEMDDFIDDEGEDQDQISKHIKEIFGYDRNKYKDESDYALRFMESSWRDLQKEEARSLKMAVQEDLEEERKEAEEFKRKNAKRLKKS